MKNVLFFLLALAALSFGARATNWAGWGDTIRMPACSSTALAYGTTPFSLTDYDMVRVICHVNDTTADGFASDSIVIRWGYQTFSLCRDTGTGFDTCYSPRVVVDTISTDSTGFGLMAVLTLDANGIANTPGYQVDTTSCAGWAVQSRTFSAEWDVYARIWVEGLTGNLTQAPLKLLFSVVRRVGNPSVGK